MPVRLGVLGARAAASFVSSCMTEYHSVALYGGATVTLFNRTIEACQQRAYVARAGRSSPAGRGAVSDSNDLAGLEPPTVSGKNSTPYP